MVEAERVRGRRPCFAQQAQRSPLSRAEAPAFRLQLKAENATPVDDDDVGRSGDDAEPFHDRGLDWPAIATVRRVEGEEARRTTGAQVLEYGTLYRGLWPLPATTGAHNPPLSSASAAADRDPNTPRELRSRSSASKRSPAS